MPFVRHAEVDSVDLTGAFVPGTPDPVADSPGRGVRPGTVIGGRYTLAEVIGEGGMGTVWRTRQTEPVRRAVAVKLIKAGMGKL